ALVAGVGEEMTSKNTPSGLAENEIIHAASMLEDNATTPSSTISAPAQTGRTASGLKVAILGIRGFPSTYGGYETFVGELAPRLAERGHDITVYCRGSLYSEQPAEHLGIKLRYVSSFEHKFLST